MMESEYYDACTRSDGSGMPHGRHGFDLLSLPPESNHEPSRRTAQTILADTKVSPREQCERLHIEGMLKLEQANFPAAATFHQAALRHAMDHGLVAAKDRALSHVGNALYSQGLANFALPFYQCSCRLKAHSRDQAGEARAHANVGAAYQHLGNVDLAMQHHEQTIRLAEAANDRSALAAGLSGMGIALYSMALYDRAVEYYMRAADIYREMGDRAREGAVLGNHGNIYHAQASFGAAEEYHGKHAALSREAGDQAGLAVALGNLANVYQAQGRYSLALGHHTQVQDIATPMGDLGALCRSLTGSASAHESLGHAAQAQLLHHQALVLAERTGDVTLQSQIHGSLGSVALDLGQLETANDHLAKALDMATGLQDEAGIGRVHGILGRAHQAWQAQYGRRNRGGGGSGGDGGGHRQRQLHHQQQAIEHYTLAVASATRIGDRAGQSRATAALASAELDADRPDRALALLRQALETAKEIEDVAGQGRAEAMLGSAYRSIGRLDEAERALAAAAATAARMGDQHGEARSCSLLAAVLQAQGRAVDAGVSYRRAYALAREMGDIGAQVGSLTQLALLCKSSGGAAMEPPVPADRCLARGLELAEQAVALLCNADQERGDVVPVTAAAAVAEQTAAFQVNQLFLIESAQYARGLAVADCARELAIQELQPPVEGGGGGGGGEGGGGGGAGEGGDNNEQQVHRRPRPVVATPEQLLAPVLAANVAVVYYTVQTVPNAELFVWCLTPSAAGDTVDVTYARQKIPSRQQLLLLVEAARRHVLATGGVARGTASAADAQSLGFLRQVLLPTPVFTAVEQIPPFCSIVFSPCAELCDVPFSALPMPDGRYLVEHRPVATAYSMKHLTRSLDAFGVGPGEAESVALVFGAPQPVPAGLRPTPASADAELRAVSLLLGCTADELLVGRAATKNAIAARLRPEEGAGIAAPTVVHSCTLAVGGDGLVARPGLVCCGPDGGEHEDEGGGGAGAAAAATAVATTATTPTTTTVTTTTTTATTTATTATTTATTTTGTGHPDTLLDIGESAPQGALLVVLRHVSPGPVALCMGQMLSLGGVARVLLTDDVVVVDNADDIGEADGEGRETGRGAAIDAADRGAGGLGAGAEQHAEASAAAKLKLMQLFYQHCMGVVMATGDRPPRTELCHLLRPNQVAVALQRAIRDLWEAQPGLRQRTDVWAQFRIYGLS